MTFGEARAAVMKVTFDRDLAGEIANIIIAAVAAEREACAQVAADQLGGYLCPYGRDKPGDPTWNHTDDDKCPVCGGNGKTSLNKCHDTAQGRIAALIRARNSNQ